MVIRLQSTAGDIQSACMLVGNFRENATVAALEGRTGVETEVQSVQVLIKRYVF